MLEDLSLGMAKLFSQVGLILMNKFFRLVYVFLLKDFIDKKHQIAICIPRKPKELISS